MAVLIAEIEGNYFYIILSILLVWRRSDLFNVSLKITGYFSLHKPMPLHITLSKLVFTSYCICFYYIMICPVSSAYTIGLISLAVDFEQVIISVILFTVLFVNQIMIFSTAHHMCHWCYLVCLIPAHWLLNLNRLFFRFFVS